MTAHAPLPGKPSVRRQFAALLRVSWRRMRRSSTRVGHAPSTSGAPRVLLLQLVSALYIGMLVWHRVSIGLAEEPSQFTWYMLGILLMAFGLGITSGSGSFRVRSSWAGAAVEALPLTTLARVGIQLTDSYVVSPLAGVIPFLAARQEPLGVAAISSAVALGLLWFVSMFIAGQASIAWARALGPTWSSRVGGHGGLVLTFCGSVPVMVPMSRVLLGFHPELAQRGAKLWLAGAATQAATGAAGLLCLGLAYISLRAAERQGIDHLDLHAPPPRAHTGVRDRAALEWQMLLRQGGFPLLLVSCMGTAGAIWMLVQLRHVMPSGVVTAAAGLAVYTGALMIITQAARAARNDLTARPFLSALPLSPHRVLESKASALRKMCVPIFVLLPVLAGWALHRAAYGDAYRVLVALVALYIAAEGAVSVAFLATGVASLGINRPGPGFSAQLLMLPLMTTALATHVWTATTAGIAVFAVTWEARRAAHKSVRWLDDPAEDAERETSVWRALLAATAFFALQALSFQLFGLFSAANGYLYAAAFGSSAVVLGLLTWRNGERFERPRLMPRSAWHWPIGLIAGCASGVLALGMLRVFPALETHAPPMATPGEELAMFATVVVMAPLIEEYFFRGWLQQAIRQDLAPNHKHWAFVLAAAAFALAHLGTYGVPQLVLGLAAGALFARSGSLWPSILAHAAHNCVVLLAQAQ
jgi:membrane protease YdiL (CAAX protease family)